MPEITLARMYRLLTLTVPLLLGGVGCATENTPAAAREAAPSQDLPIIWQTSGTYSRLTRMTHVVARDRATLARIPIAEVPVDFENQMVLVVGLGPTPVNELSVRITRVWQEGSRIRVQERRVHPGVDEPATFEPASPWTIVVVPKSDLNVEGYDTRVPKGTLGEPRGAR